MAEPKEFLFGFKLDKSEPARADEEVLQRFVQQQIHGLLDIVVLTDNGKKVSVDGFLWVKDAFRGSTDDQPTPIKLTGGLGT